jgi:hypothetical protein
MPIIGLPLPTITFVVQHNKYTQYTYALQLFLLSKTVIEIEEVSQAKSSVRVTYNFYLPGFLFFLVVPLKRLARRWFQSVFQEDHPLRLRRQKVLSMGFKDFKGIESTESINQFLRLNKFTVPIIPPSDSPLISHPFFALGSASKSFQYDQ